jgi:predicted nucleotidyltransferase
MLAGTPTTAPKIQTRNTSSIKSRKFEYIYFLMNRLETYTQDIIKLCETHKVKSLYAFGSVLTDNFNQESDIDLIVDFSNIAVEDYADNYFDFKFSLEDILKRPIDLLEEKAIKNPYFRQSVNQQRQLVYGQ